MHVLVLGGYGFIGSAVVRALGAAGHQVEALGRAARLTARSSAPVRWHLADIATLTHPDHWQVHLRGIAAVVNAAGALQSGSKDDLGAVHERAIGALLEACERSAVRRFVQISAPGAGPDASTPFMRSKAGGDAWVAASSLDWVILRPGLVLGADAYGGSALLRALAGVPLIQPVVHGASPLQTVPVGTVAQACVAALDGRLPPATDIDLVERHAHRLRDVLAALRTWLGFAPARLTVELPAWLAGLVASCADLLGRLGWRSPVRSTALSVLRDGVSGDPEPYAQLTGQPVAALTATLEAQPATLQERWFARLYLLFPLIIGGLAGFWLLSGVIALVDVARAARVLDGVVPVAQAQMLVVGGALADLVLGLAVLVRRFARAACFGMICLSIAYLSLGTWLTPQLWLDPMGVFLKTVPATVLALVASALLEER